MAIINGRGRVGARPSSGGGGSSYDADALAFFTAASITDTTQMSAVNTLVTGLKSNNLWTKIKALYPVVGGNATAHSKNLINPNLYTLTFTSGWVHSSTGMQGNAASTYASLGSTQSAFMTSGSGHMAIYSRTIGSPNRYDMGNYGGAGYTSMRISENLSIHINTTGVPFATANTDGRGFYIGSRISSTNLIQSKNATQYTATSSEAFSVGNIVIGAIGTSNFPQFNSDKQYALASIGLGLNSSEMTIYHTLVQAFQTTLGRHVGVPVVSDSDAQAFLNSANISDLTQASAVNTLVTSLKSSGVWAKMKAIYPVVGGNATAHSKNLKNPSQYNLTFSSGWSHDSSGVLPNGTSAYADTSLNIGSVMPVNSVAFGIYFKTLPIKSSSMNGSWSGGINALYRGSVIGNYTYWNGGEILKYTSAGDNYGMQQVSRYNTTHILRKHKGNSTETISDNYTSMSSSNFYLGKANGYDLFEDRKISFSYLSEGLTSSEVDSMYTAVQAFQTTLGRQV